ncbi:hypothetical protein GCM10008955_14840 [Deinococcus malanensis]|uniref:HTH luxR-type domain-containing protein n=1 Tax=Deinococcus malanensis TaxID=1706855 RepID=A0ABQ2ER46_9DEIO|nr:response regulator transcription factor [Deinococcus malanensis]GGK22355.1 hypothetical protein GCM10008955_14840 [Deinococcus malanensis]
MLNRDNADAVRWGMEAVKIAEDCQDTEALVLAFGTVGTAMLLAGNEDGRGYLERSLDLGEKAQLDQQVAVAYGNLGSVAGELYQFPRADQYLQAGLRYCAEHGIESQGHYIQAWQALSWFYQGQWNRASEAALGVTRLSRASAISRMMALVSLGRIRTRRGDPEALSALDEALAMAVQTVTLQRLAPVGAARAETAWLAGDHNRVLNETREVLELAVRHRHVWFVGELVYWRWKAGDTEIHAPMVATPFALQMAGQWREAAEEWQRLKCPYETARALAESEDETALREALNIFERLGAWPAASMTARHLREHGVRGIPRGPRAATRANPAHLTTRELEVLHLLQQGLQNAEIARKLHLSTKTAGHHVSSILSKLGVRSRTEAVREATRLALLQHGDPDRPN